MKRATWAHTGSLDACLSADEQAHWLAVLREMVEVDEHTDCWIFQGHIDRNGYAKWHGPSWDIGGWAHRNAWFVHHGPIPWHLEVDHLCFVQACVNVDHLELVTPAENKRRKDQRRRSYRVLAPIEHGSRGWIDGCRCDDCYRERPWPLADNGSTVTVEPVAVSAFHEPASVLPAAPSWMRSALCATHDQDLWTGKVGCRKVDAAKEVCDRCPVAEDCLAFAIETQPDMGIWAGRPYYAIPRAPVAVSL